MTGWSHAACQAFMVQKRETCHPCSQDCLSSMFSTGKKGFLMNMEFSPIGFIYRMLKCLTLFLLKGLPAWSTSKRIDLTSVVTSAR